MQKQLRYQNVSQLIRHLCDNLSGHCYVRTILDVLAWYYTSDELIRLSTVMSARYSSESKNINYKSMLKWVSSTFYF